MAEQQNKKVPVIRFKEFSEEWEEKAIGEVFCEKSRSIVLEDNELYELVTVKRRNGGVVSRGYLKGKDILVKNYSQLKAGDFLISKRQVVHGATGIVPEELENAIVSNEYLVSVGNENITTEFLAILSTLPDMYKKFFLSSYGVDIEKLFFDADDWKKRKVVIPQPPEQNKICSYFNELDRMIGLHQQKHEKLVTLKKAMLKKMFPQNGAATPEIRFSSFSEPWEVKKLGELVPLRGGFAFQSSHFCTKGVPIVKISNILFSGEVGGDFDYYEEQDQDENYSLSNNSAILAMSGATTGKVSILRNPNGKKIYQNQRVGYFEDIKVVDYTFISTVVRSELFSKQLNSVLVAGAQPNVSSKEINGFEFWIPQEKDEQQKLGTYFRQLDELIEQHSTQVDKLKQLKTACLEKMFV